LRGIQGLIIKGKLRDGDERHAYAERHPFSFAWALEPGPNQRPVKMFIGSLPKASAAWHLLGFFNITLIIETQPLLTGILVCALFCSCLYTLTSDAYACCL
jgi:hypothetical protein